MNIWRDLWENMLVETFKTTVYLLLVIPFYLFDAIWYHCRGDYIDWSGGGRSGIAGKLYDWWDEGSIIE